MGNFGYIYASGNMMLYLWFNVSRLEILFSLFSLLSIDVVFIEYEGSPFWG